jgi:DNA repair photolyase
MATFPTPTLFPIVPHHRDTVPPASLPPKLAADFVGIARLAADSPLADARRGTEYFLLPVRSILNSCDSTRVPFPWTINPYRGCEFGCRYCYARYTHEFMELDGAEFESKIYAKANAGPIVSRDLAEKHFGDEHIAIGSATDPYQPAEREFGVTRAILERMAERSGLSLSITTKSDQIVRDIDLLQRISRRSSLTVNITIVTMRTRLARTLEPRAPRPDLRLIALRKLRDAGISAGVFAMPVLPGLTDSEDDLDALARAAGEAGAGWFLAAALWLMPSSAKQFLPFIENTFPRLAKRYREFYSRAAYPPETYRREISERVRRLREKYNLGSRPTSPAAQSPPPQLSLALHSTNSMQ